MKRGEYYLHRHYIDTNIDMPLRCKVTRIAQGVVYYRPHYGYHEDGSEWLGSPAYFPIEDASKYFEATI